MGKLMAGFLFLFLDFRINLGEFMTVSLLPELIGFLCLFAGCAELCEESPRFSKLCPICICMAVIKGILGICNFIGLSAYVMETFVGIIFSLALTAVAYYLTYQVIAGICDIEDANAFSLGTGNLKLFWLVLVISNATALLCGFFSFLLMILFAIAVSAIAMLGFLFCFNSTRKNYFTMKDIKAKEKLYALDKEAQAQNHES